eukprot:38733-Rhodomonas_salina.2
MRVGKGRADQNRKAQTGRLSYAGGQAGCTGRKGKGSVSGDGSSRRNTRLCCPWPLPSGAVASTHPVSSAYTVKSLCRHRPEKTTEVMRVGKGHSRGLGRPKLERADWEAERCWGAGRMHWPKGYW